MLIDSTIWTGQERISSNAALLLCSEISAFHTNVPIDKHLLIGYTGEPAAVPPLLQQWYNGVKAFHPLQI